MPQIRVILFDIGNVLIGWNQSRLLDKVFQVSGVEDTAELRTLFKEWNDAWDAGSMRELSQKQIEAYPAYAPAIRAYCDHWVVSLDPAIEGSFDIAQQAKQAGYELYTASNFSADNFAIARPHMPRLDLFDALHISGTTGICKPDPLFYRDMMQRFGFSADEAIFIDDRPSNIETAAKLGLSTHLFTSPQQLHADLRTLNLL